MARVLIDGEALFRNTDGVGRFTQRLISYVLQNDQTNTYAAIGFKGDEAKPHLIDPKVLEYHYLPIPRKAYNALYRVGSPPAVDKYLPYIPDVVLYPNFVTRPRINAGRKIVVVHDLAFSLTPDVIEKKNLNYLRKWVPRSIAEAHMVVGVSRSTANDLTELLNVPKEKVRVVSNAVDRQFFESPPQSELQRVSAKFNLPEKFILHVGTIEPRKNHLGLLGAYDLLPQSIKNDYALVLAGAEGWNNRQILEMVNGLQQSGQRIQLLGRVDDPDLAALYHRASIFALPSHFEGFGLPLAEAMAAGLPSVTSNKAPMTEVAGESAVLVNPDDSRDISHGLEKLISDEPLQQKLSASAPKQAATFNWIDSARALQNIIAEVQEV